MQQLRYVQYHSSCYREYTRFLTGKQYTQKGSSNTDHLFLYTPSFEVFCQDVVEKELMEKNNVFRLTKLKQLFLKTVKSVEGKDAKTYKTWSLKRRLKMKYPQLRFLHPSRKTRSDFVYVDTLCTCTERLLNDSVESETSSCTDTDTDTDDSTAREVRPATTTYSHSTLRERHSCALDIKEEIAKLPSATLPWPPSSANLTMDAAEKLIPVKLYNFLAWVTGASTEPEEECFVKVCEEDHRHMLSISQDILYKASKGRRAMPKHTSLAMAIRIRIGTADWTIEWLWSQHIPHKCSGA